MLLTTNEPPALSIERPQGASDFLLACDHASRLIPQSLGSLGLDPDQLVSHIAWDIGAASVARRLSGLLDATLVLQNYSRLVIDCNRPPESVSSIPTTSEYARITGNEALPARRGGRSRGRHLHSLSRRPARHPRSAPCCRAAHAAGGGAQLHAGLSRQGAAVEGGAHVSPRSAPGPRPARNDCARIPGCRWETTSPTPSAIPPTTPFRFTAKRAALPTWASRSGRT